MPQDSSASKHPAVIVGGQRRRLARRSGVPRSMTLPVLNPESATASSVNNTSHTAAFGLDRQEGTSAATLQQGARPLEASQSTMNFYPPSGIPADLRPSSKSAPSSASRAPYTPPTSKFSFAATEYKKKHSFVDSLKLKDSTRALSDQTPLPPLTPSKAAKILGVRTGEDGRRSPRASHQFGLFDGRYDCPSVRPLMSRQSSAPMLTMPKGAVKSKFKEEDIDPDTPKSKSLWGSGKMKAKKLSDSLLSFTSIPQRPTSRYSVASVSQFDVVSLETDCIHRIGDYYTQPHQPQRPLLLDPAPPPRRPRKKGRSKSLDRMTPITEASYDELGPAHHDSGDSTELEVISEYEQDYHNPYDTPTLPRSRTESLFTRPHNFYELNDEVPAFTNEVAEDAKSTVHLRTPVDLNRGKWQQSAVFHMRSPLQNVKDRLLDAAELQLTVRKDSLNKFDASTSWFDNDASDEEYSEDEEHNMHGSPVELSKIKWQQQGDNMARSLYEDFMDRSLNAADVELQALESTVNKLEASKLILDMDVMTLKEAHEKLKKDMYTMNLHGPPGESEQVDAHPKCLHCGEDTNGLEHSDNDDLISLGSSMDLDEEPTVHTARVITITKFTPGMVKLIDIPPRRQRRHSYVQKWIATYQPAEQRPISDRLDQDILADRETPPAPLPKD